MRVLYVNTYFYGGGAEKVVRQLYYGMKDKGIETYCLVGRWQKNIPDEVQVVYSDFWGRCITTLAGSVLSNTLLKTVRARKKIIRIIQEKNIDIVHFHNLHSSYLGISDLQEIRKYCPNIVITLHDMWVITGCCAHAMECKKWYESKCNACQGNSYLKKGRRYAEGLLKIKEKNFTGKQIHFITPSNWLKDCCHQSYLCNEDIRVINNGIEVNLYKEWNKKEIRKKYRLPVDKRVVLFSANGVKNPYKGYQYLLAALQRLKDSEKYAFLIVGSRENEKIDLPCDIYDMGYISDTKKMNEIYAAADLFILPSMADVFPFTMLESMASGTPVLAFATGGIPEAVTKEVGWLVSKGDSQALAEKIERIFDDNELEAKTVKCSPYVRSKFTEDIMLQKYKLLYDELMESQV